jgi:sialic acid synthase SpsE/RimJ/RimL family protein N-acetyltransferase
MKSIRIGNRKIGPGEKCFIIAEAGSNHDGSLQKAYALIDAAADAGADAVKFQLFRADRLYAPTAGRSDYLKRSQSIFEIIRSMELSGAWLRKLKARCGKKKILFLASVFDEQSADTMDSFVAAHKIASYELTHAPLVRHVARLGKPVLLSTGACSPADIRAALGIIRAAGNRNVLLFQCTARYPAPPASLNLKTIPALAKALGVPVGLSDHSADPFTAPIAAVALGAVAIEKHLTLSRKGKGPDHRFSIEPDELTALVRRIRETEAALGDGVKTIHPEERELHRFARRSIFTSRRVRKGELFSAENLVVLRNGKLKPGLPPKNLESLLGKRCRHALSAYTGVKTSHVQAGKPVAPIRLRPAARSDEKMLWILRQDPEVVRYSLTGRPVSWSEHRRWFSRLMRSSNGVQWIVEDARRNAIGQVRIAFEGRRSATIHVGIDRRHRGKGYGLSAIAAAAHRAVDEWGVGQIKAWILSRNRASRETFRKAGFQLQSSDGKVETWLWRN